MTPEENEIRAARKYDHRRETARWILACVIVLAIAFVATSAATVFTDNWRGGPESREAATQSRLNGVNLCEFAVATAEAFSSLANAKALTDEQRAAVQNMKTVANQCNGTTKEEEDSND